ncbi:Speckle-type POZ protein [Araneus ventricosus]|uniref:Speckle-type POZ protein n=1 Tax=Araneus ventricosus TaxID=182803 RepID=A0A4Y2DHD9_ARAVE|nr:Speckle-type POZ protein [Araneus ventricosus]
MEYERKGVTITWQIENVKCPPRQEMELYSPVFSVDVLDRTKWKLGIFLIPTTDIRLTIKREAEDDGPKDIGLHYDFSISALRGRSSTRKGTYSFKFQKDQSCPEIKMIGRHKCSISDNITIQCKIWRQRGSIPMNDHFFSRTRMRVERSIFVGVVEHFSDLRERERKTLKTVSSPTGEILMTVNLYLCDFLHPFFSNQLKIEIKPVDIQIERVYDFKLFILDSSGKKSRTVKLDRTSMYKSPETFTLHDVSKENLIEKAARYLPNDALSLHCEITVCAGKEYEKVERTEYETDSIVEVNKADFSNEVELLTRREGIPYDTKLQTATEAFSAHTDILSAQSPVFEAMFKTSMKETIKKCVQIDDVDAETLKRMLLFLYSATLEELEWKDAMELFFAADKYQILSLKSRCTVLLMKSLDLSNCCVLLLLADMHQEEDLKKAVQNFITRNDQKILYCDQWRDFEKTVPHLAIDYFRNRCLKSRLF